MADERLVDVDSSFLVRYLTDDPPALAERAAAVLDGTEPLLLCKTLLMESVYVLGSVYKLSRQEIVNALSAPMQKVNLIPAHLPKARVLEALQLRRPSRRVSFADALPWAEAREQRSAKIHTFDRRFPAQGMALRQ